MAASLLLAACLAGHDVPTLPPPPERASPPPSPCELAAAQRARVSGLLAEGRLDRTLRVLDRADALCPASAPESWATRLRTLLDLGRTDDARRVADGVDTRASAEARAAAQAAREAPARMAPDPQAKLAAREAFDAAARAGANHHPAEAARGFLKAWSLDPTNGRALFEAGLATKQMGKPADAQRLFDRARVVLEQAGTRVVLEPPSVGRPNWGSAWSPGARLLAVAAGDAVSIRDRLLDLREIVRLDTPEGTAGAVAFSPDGKLLADGSDNNVVRLWDVATWTEARRLSHRRLHPQDTDTLKSVAFSPDGKLLASVSSDSAFAGSLRLWDVSTGAELRVVKDSEGGTTRVSFSRDGQSLAFGAHHNGVHRWSVKTGRALRTSGPKGGVAAMAFSPDGKLLATCSPADKQVHLWDTARGTEVNKLDAGDHLMSLAFSHDGKFLASGARGSAVLWEVATWAPAWRFEGPGLEVTFSPDSRLLVVDGRDTVSFLDVAKGPPARSFQPRPSVSTAGVVALSRDGTRMASVSDQNSVRLWTLGRRAQTHELMRHPSSAAIALSPDGEALASCASGVLSLQRVAAGEKPQSLTGACNNALAFSPDSQTLVSGGPPIGLWNVTIGALVRTIEPRSTSSIDALVFSPDGGALASSFADGVLRLWNPATGAPLRDIEGGPPAFSPDGKTLASGGSALRLWDVASGALVRTLAGHQGEIGAIAFSPHDGHTQSPKSRDQAQAACSRDASSCSVQRLPSPTSTARA